MSRPLFVLGWLMCLVVFARLDGAEQAQRTPAGNRHSYLDSSDPFYPGLSLSKLTTPQWVGEPGVEAVVILAIDDMRDPAKYEAFLRPALDRLKQIDGRAPVSIYANAVTPDDPRLAGWLKEGLSLEIHTLSHPCPLLQKSNIVASLDTYQGCVELMNRVPGNHPVAFRMPCCDSMNSPSPRFYAEIFNRVNAQGQFLTIDSSVMNIFTTNDPALPPALTRDADGREKFRKYLPFKSFVTTIEDYPYPYIIGRLAWEFPPAVPSDWEAQNIYGTNNPALVADWKAALDATVLKQGVFPFIFHPYGWSGPAQLAEFVDYADKRYGKRVKFLTFREAQERLDRYLLAGQPIRGTDGGDNGVRLLDVNHDGFMDVLIGNGQTQMTRVWNPKASRWDDSKLPVRLVAAIKGKERADAGVRFGVMDGGAQTVMLARSTDGSGAWHFANGLWQEDRALLNGLTIKSEPILTFQDGHDNGVRLRDLDADGQCELLVGNSSARTIFVWSATEHRWQPSEYSAPDDLRFVGTDGRDGGARFADINHDGFDDLIFSDPDHWSVHLFVNVPKPHLGIARGWSFKVGGGRAGEAGAIPMITRGGTYPNNGAWFHSGHMWAQNEDVAQLPDKVDRRTFAELLTGSEPPPKSPAESLAAMQVRDGFRVELVASEPLVQSPVAFEWGADGKLWVAEMRDYPSGMDGRGKAGGVIKYLEDTDGDGRYDKATVFLEGVNFPNGVMPWRKGVLISAAPDILYAEDTNGDGRADIRRVLLTGFVEGNQQHRVNGFDYGLDNWIYAANGESGGLIKAPGATNEYRLNGHDLRFNPDTGAVELTTGPTQFGRHRDDWGNWFGNNNPTWLWHYCVPEGYADALARAPFATRQILANHAEPARVYAISRPQQRFNWPDAVRQVTSANSATPYRDDLFGSGFARSVFMSEPANNVIHHEVLAEEGVSFRSHRAPGEEEREFIASRDNWFRPTMLKTGPDGALYFADVYRLVIEHPEYFPEEVKSRPDLRAGEDKGRLYRVLPASAKLRGVPRLDHLPPSGLVAALESSNGWERDTAQRLLVCASRPVAGDSSRAWSATEAREVEKALGRLTVNGTNPKSRLQALCTLEGVAREPDPRVLAKALADSHPAVREQAAHIAARLLSRADPVPSRELRTLEKLLFKLARDPSLRVRYVLALATAGLPGPASEAALGTLFESAGRDERLDAALRVGIAARPASAVRLLLARDKFPGPPASVALLAFATGWLESPADDSLSRAVAALVNRANKTGYQPWQITIASGVLGASQPAPGLRESLAGVLSFAREVATDHRRETGERVAAVRLLAKVASGGGDIHPFLATLLRASEPREIQQAALAGLRSARDPAVCRALLGAWRGLSPGARNEFLNLALGVPDWTFEVVSAIEAGRVSAGEIGLAHRERLLTHKDESLRARARKSFETVAADRQAALRKFAPAGSLRGDPRNGHLLYQKHCATCHRLGGEGNALGPDLETVAGKPFATLLTAILDPNQAVEARFTSYNATLKDGREWSGIIVAEDAANVTLRVAGGAEEVLRRAELKELTASGKSLMPEGFESVVTPQEMADLAAFIAGQAP